HVQRCAPCAQYAEGVERFEQQLRGRMHEACNVPQGLAERIIETQRVRARRRAWLSRLLERFGGRGGTTWVAPAIAAFGGVLALGVGSMIAFNLANTSAPITHTLIAHVQSEPGIFALNDLVAAEDVREAFRRVGGRLDGTLGHIRHLGTCMMEDMVVHHLLIETDDGQATLILVPGRTLEGKPHSEAGYTAVMVPLRGGSLGVITRSPDSTIKVRDRLQRIVRIES
ncbi:MAG TPA: DUF3379 family protein, partial [Burkholderiales bacterium]|nr:DUF3379 family protein [Burkholderiales bacterium]